MYLYTYMYVCIYIYIYIYIYAYPPAPAGRIRLCSLVPMAVLPCLSEPLSVPSCRDPLLWGSYVPGFLVLNGLGPPTNYQISVLFLCALRSGGLIFDDSIEDLASGRLLAPSCAILSLILRILSFLTQLLAHCCSSQLNLGPSWGHPGLILGFPGGS